MRYLFDIVHPAHVHFYKNLIPALRARGHETLIVAREKDVTRDLLDLYGLPYVSTGRAGAKGVLGQATELMRRDSAIFRLIRDFRPDVVLTRNPAGVQAARAARTVGVFDTDDGTAAGVHFRAAAPFAHLVTTPDCLPEHYGTKHVRYPSYKVLAYLHPNRFQPDPSVRELLGVDEDEPYFLVRFVAMTAAHDRNEAGLTLSAKRSLVDRLQGAGRVFISSEMPLPPEFERLRFNIEPHRLHDAMAFAQLCIGDSQTMAAESAVLGVPSIRCSTFAGRLAYLDELGLRYGLTFSYRPAEFDLMMGRLDDLLAYGVDAELWRQRRGAMLAEKCDLTEWYLNFLEVLPDVNASGGDIDAAMTMAGEISPGRA